MAAELRKITFLKVYTAEDVIVDDKPLYKSIIEEARRLKLAGGTVITCSEGYASEKRGIDRKPGTFFSGVPNAPIIVEIVDSRENIEKILPYLEKNAKRSLVLVEDTEYLLTDYIKERMAKQEL